MPGDAPEMPPEFVLLVEECEWLAEFRTDCAVGESAGAAALDWVDAKLDAARAALYAWHRAEVERAVREAHREGYNTAADPAWCEKQLRRAGVKAEAHEAAAEEYFWNASESKGAVTDA